MGSTQEVSQIQPIINEVLSQKQLHPQNSAKLKMLNDSVCFYTYQKTCCLIKQSMIQDFVQC